MSGTLIMEDHVLTYAEAEGQVTYVVADGLTGKREQKTVPMDHFFKALAIAVHPDGDPTADDYPDAESAMPEDHELRWIP